MIQLDALVQDLEPSETILMMGSGASLPSGAPSVLEMITAIEKLINAENTGLSLQDISQLAEARKSRAELIGTIRPLFEGLKPKRGFINIPLYNWHSIYTTNYDDLIEKAYEARKLPIKAYSSNFDFNQTPNSETTELFKIHGTIEKDESDGYKSRIIITKRDYKIYESYREKIYDRFRHDLNHKNMLIIGHSLSDPHLNDIIDRATSLRDQSLGKLKIFILSYSKDENRAAILEEDGVIVTFGGIDDFFGLLAQKRPEAKEIPRALDELPAALAPTTISVNDLDLTVGANPSRMYNGSPASYQDIKAGLTFDRDVSREIVDLFETEKNEIVTLLGGSGVGKTTIARQVAVNLLDRDYQVWSHDPDQPFFARDWISFAKKLSAGEKRCVLILDDAHSYLFDINTLLNEFAAYEKLPIKILLISNKGNWNHRVKSPILYKRSRALYQHELSEREIDALLSLLQRSPDLIKLTERTFSGFNELEKRKRLRDRARSDMFVCLKNIFANESLDTIILREYTDLPDELQQVYRLVSALETAGIRVHRQMVLRTTGIQAGSIHGILERLSDVISEQNVSVKDGIYVWRGRHPVISALITRYKFDDDKEFIELLRTVIDGINPTYHVERNSIRDLCHNDNGIKRIQNRDIQNELLRRLISMVPSVRVPRHVLIQNLIRQSDFPAAETEIRLFENEFTEDGPLLRYKVALEIARATKTKGVGPEDRRVWLTQAESYARKGIERYSNNKLVIKTLCDVGIEWFKIDKRDDVFLEGLEILVRAEDEIGDPDISRMIGYYRSRLSGQIGADDLLGSSFEE